MKSLTSSGTWVLVDNKKTQVHLEKLSTIVRNLLQWSWVWCLYGPHTSNLIISKQVVLLDSLIGKGNLTYLDKWQTSQSSNSKLVRQEDIWYVQVH